MSNFRGQCLNMCPNDEVIMREKERLVHVLEVYPGTKKPDPNRAVKCFRRSAAGQQMNRPEHVRPPDILLKTVHYLLQDVITTKILPWHAVYDFITDRLMAVRQDMVVQNVSRKEAASLLQPIVRFHAYAAYKLCDQTAEVFDPVLNNKHLQESLKKLLLCYEGLEVEEQFEFEALYVIFNLGNEEALRRALALSTKNAILQHAMRMSLYYKYGHFIQTCRFMERLPPLLSAVASLHLPQLRRRAFQVMSIAYSSKNLKFPVKVLSKILLYGSNEDLVEDLQYYGIRTDNESISFEKQAFKSALSLLKPRHENFVDLRLLYEHFPSLLHTTLA